MANVLVLIQCTYDADIINNIQKQILSVFLEYNMLNVKVITRRIMTNELYVNAHFPFRNGNCADRVTDIETVGKCKYDNGVSSFSEYPVTDEVIPKFIPGCKLRISTSIQEPYIYYNERTGNFAGMEVMLVRTIAEKMGMVPKFILIKEVRSNRVVNYTSGIYSLLLQR